MENKFKRLAKQICNELRRAGVRCHIAHYNRFNNSVYIRLGDLQSEYDSIRLSDHNGKKNTRFSVRSDLNQSCKFKLDNREFLWYTLRDVDGMMLRIKKEYC